MSIWAACGHLLVEEHMGETTDTMSTVMMYLFKQHVFCIRFFYGKLEVFVFFVFHCEFNHTL